MPANKFWDRFANRYAKMPVADEVAYQKKLQITREYLRPDMAVLEFGCGTGSTAIAQAPHVEHIKAIDFSPKMLSIAKSKADENKIANISFAQSSIEALDVPDHTYDVVMGHSILHLLKDKEVIISKVYDMLKPGGVFVTSTVCAGGKMHILKVILPIGNVFGLLPFAKFFTPEELASSFVDAGFSIEHQWQPGENKAVFIVARKAA